MPTCITSDEVVGLLEQLYDKSQKVHSRYICSKNSCSTISIEEKLRIQPKPLIIINLMTTGGFVMWNRKGCIALYVENTI